MKKRKKVYCEWGFLKKFIENRPVFESPEDIPIIETWGKMFSFLSKADIIINITKKEFGQICEGNLWMKNLWKKSTQGENGLDFQDAGFVKITDIAPAKIDDNLLNAVFLSDTDENTCIQKSRDYGIIALNTCIAKSCQHLYNENGVSFSKRETINWGFLDDLNKSFPQLKNCNSMIIADRYLFKNANDSFTYKDKIEHNLLPILNYILPDYLAEGVEFDLTIISGELFESYKECYEYICDKIMQMRPNLKCRIAFYNDAFKFHDRSIATNNVWLDCPHGFDVFNDNEDLKNSTKVIVAFPLIQSNLNSIDPTFLTFLNDVKERLSNRRDGQYSWGDRNTTNRIITYYTKRDPIDFAGLKPGDKIDLSQF